MKTCPRCSEILGDNVVKCPKCDYAFPLSQTINEVDRRLINEIYEYRVVVLKDKDDGSIDTTQLIFYLNEYSAKGWRLKNILSNELGKTATSASFGGFGSGINATIDEHILIFERRVLTLDDLAKADADAKKMQEEKKKGKPTSQKIEDKIYNIIAFSEKPLNVNEINSALDNKFPPMELLTYLKRLVDNEQIKKDGSDYFI